MDENEAGGAALQVPKEQPAQAEGDAAPQKAFGKVIDVPGFSDIRSDEDLDRIMGVSRPKDDGGFKPAETLLQEPEAEGKHTDDPEWLANYLASLGISPPGQEAAAQQEHGVSAPVSRERELEMRALQAEAEARAMRSLIESGRFAHQPTEAVPRQQLPVQQEVAPLQDRVKSLASYRDLAQAEPEEYWSKFDVFVGDLVKELDSSVEVRATKLLESRLSGLEQERAAEREAREMERINAQLTQNWNGQSLSNPVPWAEVQKHFEELAAVRPEIYDQVASQPTVMARAQMMRDVVCALLPDVPARHVARIISATRAKQAPSPSKVLAGPRISGVTSPVAAGPPAGADGKPNLTRAWLDYLHKGGGAGQ